MAPAAWHRTDQDANNGVECGHGRLKARLGPMRGRKQDRSAKIAIARHAFVQNLRRGHFELAVEEPVGGGWQSHSMSWRWRSDAGGRAASASCEQAERNNVSVPDIWRRA